MDIFNLKALAYILYFIMPGVIATKVHDMIVPSEKRQWSDMLLELVCLGGVNLIIYMTLTPLIRLFFPIQDIIHLFSINTIDYISLLWIAIILPTVAGFLSAKLPTFPGMRKIVSRSFLQPEPTAWDYAFSDRSKAYVIAFHLKSGAKVAGVVGDKAYVSSFPQPKDIYVEPLCRLDENGNILTIEDASNDGLWISMDECSFFERFPIETERQTNLWRKKTQQWRVQIAHFIAFKRAKSLEKEEEVLLNPTIQTSNQEEVMLSIPQIKAGLPTRGTVEHQELPIPIKKGKGNKASEQEG